MFSGGDADVLDDGAGAPEGLSRLAVEREGEPAGVAEMDEELGSARTSAVSPAARRPSRASRPSA